MGNCSSGENVGPETVKIEYFRGSLGRAEPIRVMLHHANVDFVEDPVSFPGWGMRKVTGNTGEFGALPIVSYQGQSMQQTITALVLRIRNSRIGKQRSMGTSMLGTSRTDRGDCNGILGFIPPAAECGS